MHSKGIVFERIRPNQGEARTGNLSPLRDTYRIDSYQKYCFRVMGLLLTHRSSHGIPQAQLFPCRVPFGPLPRPPALLKTRPLECKHSKILYIRMKLASTCGRDRATVAAIVFMLSRQKNREASIRRAFKLLQRRGSWKTFFDGKRTGYRELRVDPNGLRHVVVRFHFTNTFLRGRRRN